MMKKRVIGVALLCAAGMANAAKIQLSLYFDANASAGCAITTPAGDLVGVDAMMQLSIDDVAGVVERKSLSTCTGTAFGVPQEIFQGQWQFKARDAFNLVQGQVPLSAFAAIPSGVIVAAEVDGVFINLLAQAPGTRFVSISSATAGKTVAVPVGNNVGWLLLVSLLALGIARLNTNKHRKAIFSLFATCLLASSLMVSTGSVFAQGVAYQAPNPNAIAQGGVRFFRVWHDNHQLYIEIGLNKQNAVRAGKVVGVGYYLNADVVVSRADNGLEIYRTRTGAAGRYSLPETLGGVVTIAVSGGVADIDGDLGTIADQFLVDDVLSVLVDLDGLHKGYEFDINAITTGLASYAGGDYAKYLAAYEALSEKVRSLLERGAKKSAVSNRAKNLQIPLFRRLMLFQAKLGVNNIVRELSDDGAFNQTSADGSAIAGEQAQTLALHFLSDGHASGIVDPALRACIAETLRKMPESLKIADLNALERLACEDEGVQSLEGLQAARNLSSIFLRNNLVSDIGPLASLPQLDFIDVRNNLLKSLGGVRQSRSHAPVMFVADNCLSVHDLVDDGKLILWHDYRHKRQYNNCMKNGVDVLIFQFVGEPAQNGTRTLLYRTTSNPNAVCELRWADGAVEPADCTGEAKWLQNRPGSTQGVELWVNGQKAAALGAPAVASAAKLPHTGITNQQCYKKGSNALVACTSAEAIALSGAGKQDGMRGHINAMSYSEVPGFARTECVKDNFTGLMWEGKTSDGGLRDGSKRYTNHADGRAGSALEYVNQVNAQGLCGHHDWRLPTVDELHSLVNFSKPYPGPTIDTAWFPNTLGTYFWSGAPYVDDPASAWFVNFYGGYADYDGSRNNRHAVRLVRASQ